MPSHLHPHRKEFHLLLRNRGILDELFVAFSIGIIAIALLLHDVNGFAFHQAPAVNQHSHNTNNQNHCRNGQQLSFLQSTKSSGVPFNANASSTQPNYLHSNTDDTGDDESEASLFPGLLKLASMHCASQALRTAVKLKIPDLLDHQTLSVEELAVRIEASNKARNEEMPCHRDALFRTLRLLATIDVVREEPASPLASLSLSMESSFRFSLAPLGRSLRTKTTNTGPPSMASCVLHWMEEPLWNSWLELPDYIREGGFEDPEDTLLPFERANGGVSSDEWYNARDHPESLRHANDFVRVVHNHEIEAVVQGFDWSYYQDQRLVDVAGNNGKLAEAIARSEPSLECSCLDLPSVIERIPRDQAPHNVRLVPGNVLDPDSIPDCEVILMKHFCDRCMWYDDQTVEILRSCTTVLQRSAAKADAPSLVRRKIVIADAVLPDCGSLHDTSSTNQLQLELPLYLDAMYMLVGRERQRTRSEWKALANEAGLTLSGVIHTGVPTCSLIVLEPKVSSELSP